MATYQDRWMRPAALIALLLVSTIVEAQEQRYQPDLTERPVPRSIYLSRDPKEEVPELSVAGGIATTLRLPTAPDPKRTVLLGWEGRFEPLLVGGRSVVIVPLQDLAPGDRFMLRVALTDGTELPFTVTSAKDRTDAQVNVYPDPEAPEAVRTALEEQRKEVQSLRAETLRQREEGTSVDHALAALLARNQVALTPFLEDDKWLLKEEGVEVEITILSLKGKKVSTGKAAVIFKVTNKDPVKPWELQEARLTSWATREPKPFALRTTPSSIAPGKVGRIAVVTDFSLLDANKASDKLVLEVFRNGGQRQVYVELVAKDRR
jgi:uncharacterized protein (TIGR02268 family)